MALLSSIAHHLVEHAPQTVIRLLPEGEVRQILTAGNQRARMEMAQQQASAEASDNDLGGSADSATGEPDTGFWEGVVEWVTNLF